MKKRFIAGRLLTASLALAVLLLTGCAANKNSSTFYVRKIVLDKDEIGFRLYVFGAPEEEFLAMSEKSGKNGKNETANSSSGSQSDKNAAGQSDTGVGFEQNSVEEPDTVLVYGGKTPKDVFNAFFADKTDVYTGTLEKYVFSDALTEKDLHDAAVYLLDSPSLPLKALARDSRKE